MSNQIRVKYIDIPAQYQSLKNEILPAVEKVLESGNYILGSEVQEFEKSFAQYCETKFAIGVNDGSNALFLSMVACGIGPGDEVITAPNSFLASAWTIVAAGAKPVFVDVCDDFNIDPDKIEKAITKKTKAIMPVHLTGRPAKMDQINSIAQKYGLYVFEDSAQAVGARYKGKRTGSLGTTGCFSLHPLKNLNACGDAGVITTNNKEIYEKIIKLRNHGLRNRDECELWGYNSRLDTIQAAIVGIKLKHLDSWTTKIRTIADTYRKALSPYAVVPVDTTDEYSAYHTFIIQVDKRNELQQYLLQQGVETKIHYPIPIHLQECAKNLGYAYGDFPVTEAQSKRILSLPIYPELTEDKIDIVIQEIRSFFER